MHLRSVLERLPVPLLRVDADGTLLAVNQAGLALLCATALDEVLGISLFTFLPDEARASCKAFLEHVIHGQDGSFDVDLCALTGATYALELHAVAHPGPVDAAPSVMISARDVTSWRHLAQSLEDVIARRGEIDVAPAPQRARWAEDDSQDLADRQARQEATESERQQLSEGERDDLERQRLTIEQLNQRLATVAGERQEALEAADALRAEAATRIAEFERALGDERAILEARLLEAKAELAAAQQSHAATLEEVQSAYRATIAVLESAHESRLADAEAAHCARIADLEAAQASRLSDAEAVAAQALAREQEVRAAMTSALAKFAGERQRLESENGAARDAEHAAKAAWSLERVERRRAEDGRQQLVEAIAQLARDTALAASDGSADTTSIVSSVEVEHDAEVSTGEDSAKQSAW
jgi:PAS domain S-box-containing protein